MDEIERPWSRAEVADYLGIPKGTLARWAMKKIGPPYRVIGVHARYMPREVEAWLRAQPQRGAEEVSV